MLTTSFGVMITRQCRFIGCDRRNKLGGVMIMEEGGSRWYMVNLCTFLSIFFCKLKTTLKNY